MNSKLFFRVFLILVLVSGVIALLMTVELLPKPDNTYFWRSLYDGGHAPLFGTMSVIFLWLSRLLPFLNKRSVGMHFFIAGCGAMLFGIGVEISQIGTNRDADPIDVARNGVGILAFLLVAATFDPRLRNDTSNDSHAATKWYRQRWLIRFLALGIFAIPFIPATRWAAATIARNIRFPVLADFEDGFQAMPRMVRSGNAVRILRPVEFTFGEGKRCDQVLLRRTPRDPYPTWQLEEPYPDWTGYDSLVFSIMLQDSLPRPLWIRIHDRKHNSHPSDRFNRELTLQPGQQRIAISLADIQMGPRNRDMDVSRIRSLRLFTVPSDVSDEPEIRFLLDDLHIK